MWVDALQNYFTEPYYKYIWFNTGLHGMVERVRALDSGHPRIDFDSAHLPAVCP